MDGQEEIDFDEEFKDYSGASSTHPWWEDYYGYNKLGPGHLWGIYPSEENFGD